MAGKDLVAGVGSLNFFICLLYCLSVCLSVRSFIPDYLYHICEFHSAKEFILALYTMCYSEISCFFTASSFSPTNRPSLKQNAFEKLKTEVKQQNKTGEVLLIGGGSNHQYGSPLS